MTSVDLTSPVASGHSVDESAHRGETARAGGVGYRIVLGLIAAMLGVTAIAKTQDYYGFIQKASYYRSFSYDWLHIGAWSTILLETLLASLFVFGLWLRRFTVPVTALMLLTFSGLICHAWIVHGIDDCACLGSLAETPPWIALVKNAILLGFLLWVFRRAKQDSGASGWQLGAGLLVAAVAVAVTVLELTAQTI